MKLNPFVRRPFGGIGASIVVLGVTGLASSLLGAPATVVDIATDTWDGANLADTEPSIAVNPTNPLEIAVVTFSEGWGPGAPAPIWKSKDGGVTWTKKFQLPQPAAISPAPGDQKIAYDRNGNLFVAELAKGVAPPRCFIFRQTAGPDAPLTPGAMYGDDQPHLDVDRAMGSAFLNRVYSPWLDFSFTNQRSTVARSVNSGVSITNVGAGDNSSFSDRTTRIAIADDGKVYIIYKTQEGAVGLDFQNAHFYVRRSDDGGATWTAIGGMSGVSIHGAGTVQTWFTQTDAVGNFLGNGFGNPAKGKRARARSSDAWIAVAPGSGDVYAAYCSKDSSGFGQIYVARSTTQGATWTSTRVTDGTHHSAFPEVAVAANGTVGVLYIDYDDSGASTIFRHHFSRSFDNGATWSDEILQSMNPGPIGNASNGFLWGDYEGLTAVGHTFYGAFTGQSIGRTTLQLDPIFFRQSSVSTGEDLYVRDWTDTPASGDDGAEPSTHANFHSTSDVWERHTNAPGAMNANDQPQSDPAQNGTGPLGDNFAFARIRRNTPGSPTTVTAHFLVSEFGTGSNYVDSTGPDPSDPDVTFSGTDPTVSFSASDTGPFITSGYSWHLNPTSSTHLCLAVEISTASDPLMPPSLRGRAPGWPTTDLTVTNDNNKAQRNLGVVVGTDSGEVCSFALIHNAATFPRDMTLRYEVSPEVQKSLMSAQVEIIGSRRQRLASGGTITLRNMLPGENRWLCLRLNTVRADGDRLLPIQFSELAGDTAVNGFTLAAQSAPQSVIVRNALENHRAVFLRMAAAFKVRGAKEESLAAEKLLGQDQISDQEYMEFLRAHGDAVGAVLSALLDEQQARDSFGTRSALRELRAAVKAGDPGRSAASHISLLNRLDAFMTMLRKSKGDASDILQTVRWQSELYTRVPELGQLSCSRPLADRSLQFVRDYQQGKIGNAEYQGLIAGVRDCFVATATALKDKGLGLEDDVAAMDRSKDAATALQKAHRGFLLKLQTLARAPKTRSRRR